MSDTKRRPVIEKMITPALRSDEGITSPTTPLEFKVLSPRGLINRDMGGIGLGIVVALEKSCKNISVSRLRNVGDWEIEDETGSDEEEYTIVTCRKLNKSFTTVYHGGREIENREESCIFDKSPTRFGFYDMKVCQPSGFLSSCHLCNKRLHGKDIYMYRGEKAFCSPECRSRQITMDERPEKYCSSRASRTSCEKSTTGIFTI